MLKIVKWLADTKSLKNNDNMKLSIQFSVNLMLFASIAHMLAMEPRQLSEEYITGREISKLVRLLLASECIKGNCVCTHDRVQCRYLDAHNNYREKQAPVRQRSNWLEDQRKSM